MPEPLSGGQSPSAEELYMSFMRRRNLNDPAETSATIAKIMSSIESVLSHCLLMPAGERARFYAEMVRELEQRDGTEYYRILIVCDWLELRFLPDSDRYGLHHMLAELLVDHAELWEALGHPENHYATAQKYAPREE